MFAIIVAIITCGGPEKIAYLYAAYEREKTSLRIIRGSGLERVINSIKILVYLFFFFRFYKWTRKYKNCNKKKNNIPVWRRNDYGAISPYAYVRNMLKILYRTIYERKKNSNTRTADVRILTHCREKKKKRKTKN